MVSRQRDLLIAAVDTFHAAVKQIAAHTEYLERDKTPANIKRKSQEIDAAIEELDRSVRDLLLNEKDRTRADNPVTGEALSTDVGRSTQSALRSGIRKFFIRTCLGILIALSFNHLYGLFMSQIAYKNLSFDPNWYPLRTTAALIQRAVDITDGAHEGAADALKEKND